MKKIEAILRPEVINQVIIALNEVDGFLIGGASLDVHHFYDIFKFIEESY